MTWARYGSITLRTRLSVIGRPVIRDTISFESFPLRYEAFQGPLSEKFELTTDPPLKAK